jgi:glycosyltransferase involved in cell wall biosynthesis
MKTIGIVIPCFNEGPSLNLLIEKLSKINDSNIHFLIVDNGSDDDTSIILKTLVFPKNVSTIRLEVNQGYGSGILSGLRILQTDYVGWTHADLQTDPQDVPLFINEINNEVDFLKGKRYGRPLIDQFFTHCMSALFSVVYRKLIYDINAQPTIMKREIFEKWVSPPDDFALDLFAYLESVRLGHQIVRRQVNFKKREFGNSHWNTGLKSRIIFIKRTIKIGIKLRAKAFK